MRKLIFGISLILLACVSCHSHSDSSGEIVVSKELQDAVDNNDTTLIEKLAQRELDKTRSSIKDSSFAALIDASLGLQNLEFEIQKKDSPVTDSEGLKKLHSFMARVYDFALKRSIQKVDIDYYTNKLAVSHKDWITAYFSRKTKKELKITLALLQQDVAIASGIINGADTKEGRKEIEEQYSGSIEMIKAQE